MNEHLRNHNNTLLELMWFGRENSSSVTHIIFLNNSCKLMPTLKYTQLVILDEINALVYCW